MHRFMSGVAAALFCSTLVVAVMSNSGAQAGWVGHGGRFHGFYRGLYPYTLFGYPNYYSYGGYYPYSIFEDTEPNCDFVWRTVKHKAARRGRWTCS